MYFLSAAHLDTSAGQNRAGRQLHRGQKQACSDHESGLGQAPGLPRQSWPHRGVATGGPSSLSPTRGLYSKGCRLLSTFNEQGAWESERAPPLILVKCGYIKKCPPWPGPRWAPFRPKAATQTQWGLAAPQGLYGTPQPGGCAIPGDPQCEDHPVRKARWPFSGLSILEPHGAEGLLPLPTSEGESHNKSDTKPSILSPPPVLRQIFVYSCSNYNRIIQYKKLFFLLLRKLPLGFSELVKKESLQTLECI